MKLSKYIGVRRFLLSTVYIDMHIYKYVCIYFKILFSHLCFTVIFYFINLFIKKKKTKNYATQRYNTNTIILLIRVCELDSRVSVTGSCIEKKKKE